MSKTLGLIATAMYIATRRERLEAREAGSLVHYKKQTNFAPSVFGMILCTIFYKGQGRQ